MPFVGKPWIARFFKLMMIPDMPCSSVSMLLQLVKKIHRVISATRISSKNNLHACVLSNGFIAVSFQQKLLQLFKSKELFSC